MPRFEFTPAAARHGVISVTISSVMVIISLLLGVGSPLMFLFGPMFYLGREVCDLEKRHNWKLDRWNAMEFLWPLILGILGIVAALILGV